MSPSSSQTPLQENLPPDKPTSPHASPALPTLSLHPAELDQPHTSPPPAARPPFTPFFTLITDTETGTSYHPTSIHYIFSDDDPDLLTNACLDALHPSPPSSPAAPRNPAHPSASATSSSTSSPPQNNPPRNPEPSERANRVLVLDLDESGTVVQAAHSLSSSWQVLSTSLVPAPTWDSSPEGSQTGDEGKEQRLMLRVEGTGVEGLGESGGEGMEDIGMLVEEFERRMGVLRAVVAQGVVMEPEVEGEDIAGEGDGEAEA